MTTRPIVYEAFAHIAVDTDELDEVVAMLRQAQARFAYLDKREGGLTSAERLEYDIIGGVFADVRNMVRE